MCGAPRSPFAAPILELSGKPHQLGGRAAMAGAVALALAGLLVAALLGGVLLLLAPASAAGWLVGLAVLIATAVLAALLWRGGRSWERTGLARGVDARQRALIAAARARGGRLDAEEAGRLLKIAPSEADAALMELLRAGKADVDLDDAGTIRYRIDPALLRGAGVHSHLDENDPFVDDEQETPLPVRRMSSTSRPG